MIVKKAGCILLDIRNKKVGLIYRENLKDFSFPKGHLEKGETLEECAIRETAEETKRDCEIVKSIKPYIEEYISSAGENSQCYMYVAIDKGLSANTSTETMNCIGSL
jgi:8-oxo-dGTP pyrophosphatase MutT (NUDIX family)